MSIPFHNTGYGRRFFDQQLPELIKAINRLAIAQEKSNELLEQHIELSRKGLAFSEERASISDQQHEQAMKQNEQAFQQNEVMLERLAGKLVEIEATIQRNNHQLVSFIEQRIGEELEAVEQNYVRKPQETMEQRG